MSNAKPIRSIGIVGSGVMGRGIAQVSYTAGYRVTLVDKEQNIVDKSIQKIGQSLLKLSQKGRLDQRLADEATSKIVGTTEITSLSNCDLVIEAVFENEDIKKTVLKELDQICCRETILASNTSSLSISRLGAGLSRIENIVGMHFFNPVPVMHLVEIVNTVQTSAQTLERVVEFVKSIQKKPVVVRDQAGFVVNYILTPFLFDAVNALSQGLCSVEEIDNAFRYGCGHPMGPLALCDMIGLDILVTAGNKMFEEYHDRKYAPPPLMKRLVDVGDFGVKTGQGFYRYNGMEKEPRQFSGPLRY